MPTQTFHPPAQLAMSMDNFNKFYEEKHNGRKLNWVMSQARGEITSTAFGGKKIFMATTAQMAVLMLYNEGLKFTAKDICEKIGMDKKTMVQTVASLVKNEVLNGKDSDGKTDYTDDEMFNLNISYKNKKVKIDLSRLVMRADPKQEQAEVTKNVEEDRKNVIMACIVRIMKMRKTINHQQLMAEVLQQLSTRFKPRVEQIKKCIGILMEKEYMRRSEEARPQSMKLLLLLALIFAVSNAHINAIIPQWKVINNFSYISPWTGRFYSLLDPTYAKDHIPIIASVSEHQPTAWSSFMFDFHILLFLFPAGLYFCFKRLSDATIFIVMYGLTSMYFAGVMVRLILVATPAVCLISAIAVSATVKNLTRVVRAKSQTLQSGSGKGTSASKGSSKGVIDNSQPFQKNGAIVLLLGAFYLLSRYAIHCTWVTSEAYSSPSIVLAARGAHGQRVIFDDYREAYFWLRQNTPPDAKVMSWWDYGYQITAMGNRTVIVDNNTWNNTHIATVGRAMSSYEDEAYDIMKSLDVDYVLVVFGGVTGYSSDDINKFLWMVRIGGGVFPVIKEPDYLVNGEYRVDKGAAPKMLNCLMYKLSYYRFGELTTEYGKPPGYDRARGVEIGNKDIKLEYLEEAFTTQNWIVRIYSALPAGAGRSTSV